MKFLFHFPSAAASCFSRILAAIMKKERKVREKVARTCVKIKRRKFSITDKISYMIKKQVNKIK